MSERDGTVQQIIGLIATARRRREEEAASAARTADAMFGGVATLVRELQPALEQKFPELEPAVEIGAWVQESGGYGNRIMLRRKGSAEHPIKLQMIMGETTVLIKGQRAERSQVVSKISAEIIDFFSND